MCANTHAEVSSSSSYYSFYMPSLNHNHNQKRSWMIDLHTTINSYLQQDDTNKVFRLSSIAVETTKPEVCKYIYLYLLLIYYINIYIFLYLLFIKFLFPLSSTEIQSHTNYGSPQFEIGDRFYFIHFFLFFFLFSFPSPFPFSFFLFRSSFLPPPLFSG